MGFCIEHWQQLKYYRCSKIAGNIPVDALNQEQSKTEIHAPMTVVVKENPSEREIARQQQLQWQKAAYDF